MDPNVKLFIGIGVVLVAIILSFAMIGRENVEGSEVCVWQNWYGVKNEVSGSGTYFYLRPFSTPYTYYVGTDTFVVDDKIDQPNNNYMNKAELQHNQCDVPPISIPVAMEYLTAADKANGKTTGPTPVVLRCIVQFHIDPSLVLKLHKEKTASYRTTFMKGVVIDNLISHTTVLDARTVYVGEGRNKLAQDLDHDLKADARFKEYGIVIEKFVLKDTELVDKDFLTKMTAESRAEQTRRTAEKQKIASEAEAEAAKAAALAEQNKRLVEAETKKNEQIAAAEADKQKQILAAQAQAEQVVLAAKADADKVKLAAEAEKDRMALNGEGERAQKTAQADGVLALGKAEAEAQKLKLATYEGVGGQRFAEIEKAKAMGAGIQKIYYIPEHMGLTAVAQDFQKAVQIALPTDDNQKK